jgi:hypothetical protein
VYNKTSRKATAFFYLLFGSVAESRDGRTCDLFRLSQSSFFDVLIMAHTLQQLRTGWALAAISTARLSPGGAPKYIHRLENGMEGVRRGRRKAALHPL